ncbi:MAG: hypothetical protein KAG06_04930, partial [Methylococcales bacterium]|nr:hypothetical protein [Methylococcales bacterium]
TVITHRLLQLLEEKPQLIQACLQQIASEMNLSNSESLIENGLEIARNLIDKDILLHVYKVRKT